MAALQTKPIDHLRDGVIAYVGAMTDAEFRSFVVQAREPRDERPLRGGGDPGRGLDPLDDDPRHENHHEQYESSVYRQHLEREAEHHAE